MEVSEPKSVNPVLKTIEVNSLRLGGLQIMFTYVISMPDGKDFYRNIIFGGFLA